MFPQSRPSRRVVSKQYGSLDSVLPQNIGVRILLNGLVERKYGSNHSSGEEVHANEAAISSTGKDFIPAVF